MYYRSNWPELGLDGPLTDGNCRDNAQLWQGTGENTWRWVSELDEFETRFYGIPIWNVHLEILDSGKGWLARGLNGNELFHNLQEIARQFLAQTPWSDAYVTFKLVQQDLLHKVLIEAGFEQVEHRCIYRSHLKDLNLSQDSVDHSIHYQSMDTVSANLRDSVREQILEICTERFQRGYSRHFSDHFLLQRAPGLTYILDVMKLNFERTPLHFLLLALDADNGRVCGFSILSQRSGVTNPHYTQLLSAVAYAYQERGVYTGLSQQLTELLPGDSLLLNITHADNYAMRRAYLKSGRVHHADTLVLRRVFGADAL